MSKCSDTVRGRAGWALDPDFGSSVNPIAARGWGRLCPPQYCLPTQIWKPISISAMNPLDKTEPQKRNQKVQEYFKYCWEDSIEAVWKLSTWLTRIYGYLGRRKICQLWWQKQMGVKQIMFPRGLVHNCTGETFQEIETLKFIYSEKATKFCEISTLFLS